MDFPLHGLDLGSYVLRAQGVAPLYDCFAVSNHFGSMGGGHYTAYAKLPGPPAGTAAGADGAEASTAGEKWVRALGVIGVGIGGGQGCAAHGTVNSTR